MIRVKWFGILLQKVNFITESYWDQLLMPSIAAIDLWIGGNL